MARGLLARLGSNGDGSAPSDDRADIADHLKALLNTRLGDAATAPDYGVMDFTDVVHTIPASITGLQASIRATLLRYEPRLKNVVVRHVKTDDLLQLRFEITADIEKGGRIHLHTRLRPGGRFDVQP